MKHLIKIAIFSGALLLTFQVLAQKTIAASEGPVSAELLLKEGLVVDTPDSLFWFEVIQLGMDTLDKVGNTDKRQIYLNAGQVMLSLLHADSALYFFQQAAPLFSSQHPDKAQLYMHISDAWYHKMAYSQTTEYLFKALEIFETQNDKKSAAQCLAKIGDALDNMEDYEASIAYFYQAVELQKQIDATEGLADSYRMMSRTYIFLDSLDRGMEVIDRSIYAYRQLEETHPNLYRAYNAKGNLLKYLERYDSAIHYYQLVLDHSTKTDNKIGMLVANGNLGHVYRLNKNYEAALPHSLEAIELSHKTGDTRNLWENYMHASIIYEMLGDYEQALRYNINFSEEREKLFEQGYNNLKSEYQIKYETQKKDQEIIAQQAQLASNKRVQRLTYGILILLSILLAGLFWVFQNNRKKNALLRSKNEENELLLKEIHHRVKNNLERISSLLYLQATTIDDPNALDAIRESQNRVDSMSLIHKKLYMGKNLAAIDMQDYLKTLGDNVLDSFAQKEDLVNLHYEVDKIDLDVDTAIPLGLIINEILTNALKYAFPGHQNGEIRISLKQKDGRLKLQIADNGIGSSPGKDAEQPKGTGFGSQLIQLLSTQLGGQMQKYTEKGTTFIFDFEQYQMA